METFTPYSALLGGEDGQWRLLFLAGLVADAGPHRLVIAPEAAITFAALLPILVGGGRLVGLGTHLGGVRIPCLPSTLCCRPRATSTRG